MKTKRLLFKPLKACCILVALGAAGCGVEAEQESAGGIGLSLDAGTMDSGTAAHGTTRGFIVVHSDFQTSSISVVSADGELLTDQLLTSSSEAPGLSQAISGDIVPSSSHLRGDHAVVVDRGNGVVTFVQLDDASVSQQVNVSPGFFSNPHDYVPMDEETGFVLRYGHNEDPGAEPFDEGSDVLIVDPSSGDVRSSISLLPALEDEAEEFLPRATQGMMVGSRLVVLATVSDRMFNNGTSRLVIIDPDAENIERVVEIEQVSNCENMSLSPDETRLALACWGDFGSLDAAGIVVVDMSDDDFDQEQFSAEELGDRQVNNLDFSSDESLMFTSFADSSDDDSKDTLNSIHLSTRELVSDILQTAPFNLGDVRCSPDLQRCLVADAQTEGGTLHHFRVLPSGRPELEHTLRVQGVEPPRHIGLF